MSIAVLSLLAGCSGSIESSTPTPAAGPAARAPSDASTGCSTAVASSRRLSVAAARFVPTGGSPFGIAADRHFAFVDVGTEVDVYGIAARRPRLLRRFELGAAAVGSSLTRDRRLLLIADGNDGATVVNVARAERGQAGAVLGTLESGAGLSSGLGYGAIEATSSADGRYAFVAIEYAPGAVAVYNLARAVREGFKRSTFVGAVRLGEGVVGIALSPDGRWLYATSEAPAGGRGAGTLSVIDVRVAERDPRRAVVATVRAGCSPVRVRVSLDGRTVWVTARGSDQLLAFSAAKLRRDPAHALLAAVRVGAAPVGLALIDRGRRVLVADSNRFARRGVTSELTEISVAAALAGRRAVLGTIRTGGFPREVARAWGRALVLVGDYGSGQLQLLHMQAADHGRRAVVR